MLQTRVLVVGNCDPDHGAIRALLQRNFEVEVERVMFVAEALQALRRGPFALVLVNRLIFADQSDGAALIAAMRTDPALASTPVMLISNFADAQDAAVVLGAERGFGKAELNQPATVEHLARWLPRQSGAPLSKAV